MRFIDAERFPFSVLFFSFMVEGGLTPLSIFHDRTEQVPSRSCGKNANQKSLNNLKSSTTAENYSKKAASTVLQ